MAIVVIKIVVMTIVEFSPYSYTFPLILLLLREGSRESMWDWGRETSFHILYLSKTFIAIKLTQIKFDSQFLSVDYIFAGFHNHQTCRSHYITFSLKHNKKDFKRFQICFFLSYFALFSGDSYVILRSYICDATMAS